MKTVFKFLAVALFLTSCKNASLMKRKYTDGYYFSTSSKVKTPKANNTTKNLVKNEAIEQVVVSANKKHLNNQQKATPLKPLLASKDKSHKTSSLASKQIKPLIIYPASKENKPLTIKNNFFFSNQVKTAPPQAGQGGGGFVAAVGGFFISVGFLFLYLGGITLEPAFVAIGIMFLILGFLISIASLMLVFNMFPGI